MVVVMKEKSKLDLGILMAVDRFVTGANVHNLRGLANAYVLACESDQARAAKYLSRLLREISRNAGTPKHSKASVRFDHAQRVDKPRSGGA